MVGPPDSYTPGLAMQQIGSMTLDLSNCGTEIEQAALQPPQAHKSPIIQERLANDECLCCRPTYVGRNILLCGKKDAFFPFQCLVRQEEVVKLIKPISPIRLSNILKICMCT